ncbi:MAG: 50S ribosomal protein L25 [Oligoflexia bacterium]|nr:50S ribosomal protein L25 [Oligoflexia bacterium]
MATVSLDASLRTATGKGGARKARAAGVLPAVVYRGGATATPIAVDPDLIELAFAKTGDRNTLVVLDISGDRKRTCLVKDVQRHPVSRRLEHLDFYEVDDDQYVTVEVRVRAVGEAVAYKLGGRLQTVRRTLILRCQPANIPSTVDIDVTAMDVGDLIRASEVSPPANTEIIFGNDFNVLAMIGKPVEIVEDEDEEESETAEDTEATSES